MSKNNNKIYKRKYIFESTPFYWNFEAYPFFLPWERSDQLYHQLLFEFVIFIVDSTYHIFAAKCRNKS